VEVRHPLRKWPLISATLLLAVILFAFRGSHDRSSSTAQRLVRLTSTSGVNSDPALSRDGSLLAYASDRAGSGDFDIYVQPTAGGRPTKTEGVQALRTIGIHATFPIPGAWSARNNAVLFATNEADNSNIWQVSLSRTTNRVIGSPERLTFGSAIERNPVIADN